MRNIAAERGGECHSTTYFNINTPLKWCCEKGHEWKAVANHIVYAKSWCPTCSRNSGLKEAKLLAEQNGGSLVSKSYENTQLEWECHNGHRWTSPVYYVKKGLWCKVCSVERKIYDMKMLASKFNGKCLSDEYKGVNEPLDWECQEGHRWSSPPVYIRRSRWCKVCKTKSKYPAHRECKSV